MLAEPGDTAPDAHAIGLALLDCLQALADQGPRSRRARRRSVARPGLGRRAADRVSASERGAVGLLATVRQAPEVGEPFELERVFPDGRLERLSLGPLSLGALHRLLEERLGLELTRPELARVQEATAGNPFFALELGRELVRTNTRPTPGRGLARCPTACSELLGGRLDRLPGHTLDVLLEPQRSPGRRSSSSRPRMETASECLAALEAAVHEGVVQLDDSHVRFAHPLARLVCLRAGAGLETPGRASHARRGGDGLRGAGPPSGARRRRPRRCESPPSSRRPPSTRPPVARPPPRPSSASSLPSSPRTIPRWHGSGACERRRTIASRATARSQPQFSSSSSPRSRPASSGRTCSLNWSGLSRPTSRRCSSSPTRLSPRPPTTMLARHGSWPFERGATS